MKTATPIAADIKLEGLLQGSSDQVRVTVSELLRRKDAVITQREQCISRQEARIAHLELQVKLREEQLRLERIRKYGPKGEQLSHEQIRLLDLEPGVQSGEVAREAALPAADKQVERKAKAKPGARYSRAHPGRTPLPAHLPRREVIVPCMEAPDGQLLGYEVKEELVIKPAEFHVDVIKREKRRVVVAGRSSIVTAPMPPRIIDKGQLGNSVVVELLVSKYCDHLPAYRQRQRWERDHGVAFADSLLIRAMMKGGDLLKPLAAAIGADLKQGRFMQADETRVAVLQQDGKGRNDTAWFWQYSRPAGAVYFDYQDSRSRAGPADFLAGYAGSLQSDGYEVYTNLGRQVSSHAGCWAHVRRKFEDAMKAAPKEVPCRDSAAILKLIAGLYAVESQAREAGMDADTRLALRQARGLPAQLAAILAEVVEVRQRVLPASLLGKACDYTLGQWPKLLAYAGNGEIEIDNNWCENGMRPIAVGRKNWLHLGSQESGPKVAAIMTVIASAQRAGLNPRDYLAAVLERLADPQFKITQIHELLPKNWRAAPARDKPIA